MAGPSQQPLQHRTLRHASYGASVLVFFLALGWYLTSAGFREVVRGRVRQEIADATGGRVEIERLEWNVAELRFAIQGLTVHGLEAAGDAPLLHVDRIDGNLRIVSLLGRKVSFNSLVFERPSVNLIVYPDGRTNQPAPRTRSAGRRQESFEPLFNLAIRDLVLKNGALQVNEQKTPFNLAAKDVAANVGYLRSPECYDGKISIGKFDTNLQNYRPFASTANFDFRLFRNSLVVRTGQVSSESSQLSFSGSLEDFSRPRVAFNYKLKLDLRQLGAVVRTVALQAGVLQMNGNAQAHDEQMTSSGNLQLSNGSWNAAAVHVSAVSGSASFRLDQDRLDVNRIVANALGGTITGQMTVLRWNAPPRAEKEPQPKGARSPHSIGAREQTAKATFTLRGIDVQKIAALFATRRLPLDDLHPSGVADADAQLTWVGTPRASQLSLDVRSSPGMASGGETVPLEAHVQGVYDFRTASMQINLADLQTASTHLTASGSIGESAVDLSVSASTAKLREFEPLLAANGAGKFPVELKGEGSFQGTLSGSPSLPAVAGHLKLHDFTTLIQPNQSTALEPQLVKALHRKNKAAPSPQAPPTGKPFRFHWDSFDGNVTYGPARASVRDGVLTSGSSRIDFAGTTSLKNGSFTDDSVFQATSAIHNARVEDAQALLGLNYPVTGKFNLELEIAGTGREPKGTGTVSISDGTAYGEPLESLSSNLNFSGREARFTDLKVVSGGAKAQGTGSINLSSEQFRLAIQGSGVDLLRFRVLQTSKVKLTGIARFTAKGGGTLSAPSLEGEIHISNVSLGGKREGDLDVAATTVGENLNFTAESHFVTATLTAGGRIRLRGDFDCDITAKFGNVDLQPFLVGVARGHSSIDGTVHATGPVRYPERLNARLEIPRYESQVETVVLHNSGPIVATYADGTATLQSFRLVGDETDLTSSGTAKLVGTQELKMRADGQLNLKLLQSFDPEIVAYGQTLIGVRVGGTLEDPALRGRITIEHAGIAYVDMPNGLSDLNGTLVFNEDRLQVEKLTAHTGGGDLAIGGFISYGRNISFNLTATGKDVRIRYPEGVSANADADLRLAGTLQNATLSGDVVVNKFGLNPRFDFAYYLTRSKQTPTAPNPDSPLNNLHFDVRVVSTPELQVQTSLAKITGDVDLRLRGTAFRPVVLGRISIVEGDVTFNGTKYRLDRGDILFTNPTKIEPLLDLEASARVSDYDISIGLHGTTDKLNTTYRSDPPLPTADVFALLAFGRTTDQAYTAPQSSNAFTESASSAVLGSALNAAVSSRVQKLFGASRIKIDPEVGGAENNPNARITVEQQVSGNITLTYITNLAQSAQQVIQFQYNVNRNLSIVGVRDEYGVVGFEVQVRQRRR